MEKIALITDSASDLSLDELKQNNIELLPFRIIYSEGEYDDVLEITPDQVYDRLKEEIPKTSLPNIEKMDKLFTRLEEEGYTHVIVICISCHLSGTSNSVRLTLEEHPNLKSFVFDSKTLSAPQGTLVLETARLLKSGLSFDAMVEKLPILRSKSHGYFTIDTLEYLQKGGRIGKVAGTIGNILNLKPIIWVGDDGIYHTHAKVRGQKQALSRLQKIAFEYLDKTPCKVAILNGGAKDYSDKLYDLIKDHKNITEVRFSNIGPALSVNTGPGTIGVVLQEDN